MMIETHHIPAKTKWTIDLPHSENAFKIRHLMITDVKGSFRILDARILTEGKDVTAETDPWIDASSITTGALKTLM
jgi:polyisoprenoid-binding protein YceI